MNLLESRKKILNTLKDSVSRGNIYGKVMLLIGALMIIPIIIIPFYPHELKHIYSFAIPSTISILSGVAVCRAKNRGVKSHEWQSSLQEGSLPVLFAWCYGIFMGAIPFVISKELPFIYALFESTNGWTTTGMTIAEVGSMPKIFLFHRSFMQYCGGLGFMLMILMLISGKQSTNLFNAEGHPDRLMPNIRQTGRTIFLIYNGFLIFGSLLYIFFGMSAFDALCHTMSALSTAGFTTQAESIGAYQSFAIEVITILLMLIGSTNFAVLLLLTRLQFKKILRVSEMRFMIFVIILFTFLIALGLIFEMKMSVGKGIHQALFSVVTVLTTTGYSTVNYLEWTPFAVFLLVILMNIGGSAGSTAGGIKLLRVYLMIRISHANIKEKLSPSNKITVLKYYRAQGKELIDNEVISDTLTFISCYAMVIVTGTLLITFFEKCSLSDALFEFASVFTTVGISNGLTSTTTSTATLIVEMVGMLLGRLEIMIVFIGIRAGISKIKNKIRDLRRG